MKCNNCSAELAEGSLFCPYCGSSVKPAPVEPAYDYAPATAFEQPCAPTPVQNSTVWAPPGDLSQPNTIFCGHCGNQVPEDAAVCSACGLPPTDVVTPPPPKKKPRLGLWILAAVAGILVIAVIAGLCTNWFGFYGPATQIASAANNTLKAGSFTIDLSLSTESSSSYSSDMEMGGTIEVEMDVKDRELKMYAELEAQGETATMAIYDEYFIFGAEGYYRKTDISEPLEAFFDAYESTKELDWEELLNSIEEDLYDEVSEVIDFDELEKCLIAYGRKLNSTKWLKENAGYSYSKKDGVKLHQFKPKTYNFLTASFECFEDAFVDEDDYEDAMDELKDMKSEMNDVKVDLTFGIKSNKLKSVEMEMDFEGNTMKFELQFDKIGKTSIDEDQLEEMLDDAY